MSGWVTAAPVIKQLFGDLALDPSKVTVGSPTFDAEWKEGQTGAVHEEQRLSLQLKVTTVAVVGEDEIRDEFIPASISAVTKTGPGRSIVVTGEVLESGHGIATVTTGGAPGVAACDWEYETDTGTASGSVTIGALPTVLGTTGLLLAADAGPGTYDVGTVFEWDAVASHLESTNWGTRRITLQVKASVPDRTDADWAMAPIMRVMLGLRRRTSLAALAAVDVALESIGKAIKANWKDSSRVMSAALMDVTLLMLDSGTDPDPTGWIETIELTSHVQATPGVDIPLPLQMDHEILPP